MGNVSLATTLRHRSRSRKWRRALALTAGAALSLGLAACSSSDGTESESGSGSVERVSISFTDILSPSSAAATAFESGVAAIEEASGGEITFNSFFSATLLPGDQVLTGVGDGIADMGMAYSSYFPKELPIADWMNGLTMLYSPEFPESLLAGAAASNQIAMDSPELAAELEAHNLKLLWAQDNTGPFSLMCTQPVETLEDAKGLRVRTGGLPFAKEAEALGMIPVSLPTSEMYEALQRGVVDCVISHPPTAIDSGIWEVAPHVTPAQFSGYNGNLLVINLDKWNSLSEKSQRILEDGMQVMWSDYIAGNIAYYERFATEGAAEHGTTFHNPSVLNEALSTHREGAIKELVNTAPSTLTDPQGTVDAFNAAQAEWATRIAEAGIIPEGFPTTPMEQWGTTSTIDLDAYGELIRSFYQQ